MIYYLVLSCYYATILCISKIMMFEMMNKQIKKKKVGLNFYLSFNANFRYRKPVTVVILCVLLYGNTSLQVPFTMIWFLELSSFMATLVLGDMLSQYLVFLYGKKRFKNEMIESNDFVASMHVLLNSEGVEEVEVGSKPYDLKNSIKEYVKEDDHIALVGENLQQVFNDLNVNSAVNYVLDHYDELKEEELPNASYRLVHRNEEDGLLPFKDDKLNCLVSHFDLYDLQDANRVLKSGGYVLFESLGSQHFIELSKLFSPRSVSKEPWGLEEIKLVFEDENFEIIQTFEHHDTVHFNSIKQMKSTVKRLFNVELIADIRLMDFYYYVSNKIKSEGSFKDEVHTMFIIARKK